MKIDALNPNILRIAIHQEDKDPHYGSCLWAYYDFDLDRYMLNIQSDCGDAAYRWCETPDSESFLQLMARIDDDYLMYKLFLPDEVDVSATIDGVRDYLGVGGDDGYQNVYLSEAERRRREEALEELEELLKEVSGNYVAAQITLENWNTDHDFDINCTYGYVAEDFNAWQKRIVELFRDYVQPKIREIIKRDAEAEHENA